ncbi:hypothetical protein PF003_g9626 [Phytophthora fragariae]|nr:hypothetical protein PF003_g9626 [Phytophthora fragariae]
MPASTRGMEDGGEATTTKAESMSNGMLNRLAVSRSVVKTSPGAHLATPLTTQEWEMLISNSEFRSRVVVWIQPGAARLRPGAWGDQATVAQTAS